MLSFFNAVFVWHLYCCVAFAAVGSCLTILARLLLVAVLLAWLLMAATGVCCCCWVLRSIMRSMRDHDGCLAAAGCSCLAVWLLLSAVCCCWEAYVFLLSTFLPGPTPPVRRGCCCWGFLLSPRPRTWPFIVTTMPSSGEDGRYHTALLLPICTLHRTTSLIITWVIPDYVQNQGHTFLVLPYFRHITYTKPHS